MLSEALEVMEKQVEHLEQQIQAGGSRSVKAGDKATAAAPGPPGSGGIGYSGAPGDLDSSLVLGSECVPPLLSLLKSLRAENRSWRLLTTKRMMSSLFVSPLPLPGRRGERASTRGEEKLLATGESSCGEEHKENVKCGKYSLLHHVLKAAT